jgi:protocatechuate 3,4-dioxygenase alpha subunit
VTAEVTPSQTVGPFFGVGLPYEGSEAMIAAGAPGSIRVQGQVIDGRGDPVPDALIEMWEPSVGFGRARTDQEGAFRLMTRKPASGKTADGHGQAPHLNVTVFARGLLRQLVTRMYFPDETAANDRDHVLQLVEPERRQTLIAEAADDVLHFDIHLQGRDETVFLAI